MRRAARVDANHPAVVEALRKMGCSVQSLARLGDGAPDLVVGYQGFTMLMEVKIPGKKLKPHQAKWAADWRGGPCLKVSSPEEAVGAVWGHFRGMEAAMDVRVDACAAEIAELADETLTSEGDPKLYAQEIALLRGRLRVPLRMLLVREKKAGG